MPISFRYIKDRGITFKVLLLGILFIGSTSTGFVDAFICIDNYYEDPYPIDDNHLLVSRTISFRREGSLVKDAKMGIYLIGRNNMEELLPEGFRSFFDPMIVAPRSKPPVIPFSRNFRDTAGVFYVQNVYGETHMERLEIVQANNIAIQKNRKLYDIVLLKMA
jgi:hypothetical protein